MFWAIFLPFLVVALIVFIVWFFSDPYYEYKYQLRYGDISMSFEDFLILYNKNPKKWKIESWHPSCNLDNDDNTWLRYSTDVSMASFIDWYKYNKWSKDFLNKEAIKKRDIKIKEITAKLNNL